MSDWRVIDPGRIGYGTAPHPFTVRWSDSGREVRFIVERPGAIFAEAYVSLSDAKARVSELVSARQAMGLPA